MDEMRFISKFMTKIISKAVETTLRKKLGYNIDIQVNELVAKTDSQKIKVHVDADVELTKEELSKILENIGLN